MMPDKAANDSMQRPTLHAATDARRHSLVRRAPRSVAGLVALVVLSLGALTTGCRRETGQEAPSSSPGLPAPDAPSARIWVTKDGAIELDGKSVSLDLLEARLTDLAEHEGVVLYGRDAPEEDPHPNGMKVIQLVVQKRLPIRMSTKRDFSDAVRPDGKVQK